MKIIRENVVYVQRDEVGTISRIYKKVPAFIIGKLTKDFTEISFIDNSNRFEFLEFTEPEAIEFFKNASWIVDYDECKDLTVKEIEAKIDALQNMNEDLRDRYSRIIKASNEAMNKLGNMIVETDLERYSFMSLYLLKSGEIYFDLPEGFEMPGVKAPKTAVLKRSKLNPKNWFKSKKEQQ